MLANAWTWLMESDQGLAIRIATGTCLFLWLAIREWLRKGGKATRWKEYLFLFSLVGLAMAYGVINDQITCTISWQYFYTHDEQTAALLGPSLPPPVENLRWAAFLLGLKATWTAGLILGVALLLANNPSRRWPQLPYRRLYRAVMLPLFCAVALAALLGAAGYFGILDRILGESRPAADWWNRLMCVYGIHLGGYLGAAIGLLVAIVQIRESRKRTVSTQ